MYSNKFDKKGKMSYLNDRKIKYLLLLHMSTERYIGELENVKLNQIRQKGNMTY